MDRLAISYNVALRRLWRFEPSIAALVYALLMFTVGCSDAGHVVPRKADASVGPDADGGAKRRGDGALDADAAQVDAAAMADDASVGVRFEITLSTSACKGECPMYDIELDQTGSVMFNGRGYTRQQGWGGRTVSQETAAEVLELVDAADYWSLQEVYRETSDGCSEVEPDRPTYIWSVTMDGPKKIVVDYQGCKGVRALDALREIPAQLIETLGLATYLGR